MKPKLVWEGLRRELVDPPYKKDLKSQVGKYKCTEQFVLTDMITTILDRYLKEREKLHKLFSIQRTHKIQEWSQLIR